MKTYLMKHDKIKYSDHWSTPKEIYEKYIDMLYYDPCPLYAENFDFNHMINRGNLYINPPYSNIMKWVNYAWKYKEIHKNDVVMLLPVRTGTKWFFELLTYGIEIEFIKGRLKFGNSKNSAPFDSMIIRLL